ncbi:MAG TPA: type II secretion system secretin GspD [bacterium]|nr:type II secretion system secretin GspD [bacterium]
MALGRSLRRLLIGFMIIGLTLSTAGLWSTQNAYAQDENEDDQNEEETTEVELDEPAAAPAKECPAGLVSLDFVEDMDVRLVVKMIAKKLNKSLLLDKSISGTISIIAPDHCMTPEAAYDIFESVLNLNGLTTVQVGEVIKIVKRSDAQSSPVPTLTGSTMTRSNERYITQLIPLQNLDAVEIANSFRSLVSGEGNLFAYGPANMLIIMDSAANINRIIRILQKLDVEGAEQMIDVIPIEYAAADVLADVVMQLFEQEASSTSAMSSRQAQMSQLRQRLASRRGGARAAARLGSTSSFSQSIAAGGELKIIPDTRTNSLVVKANKLVIKRVRDVVAKLDAPLPGGEGKIHVVYCENADAEELAGVLADLAGSGGGVGSSRTSATSARSSRLSSSRAGNVASAFGSRFGGSTSGLSSRTGLGSTGGTAGNPRRGITQTTGRFLADFDGAVRITSDPATNSLVIIASNRDFQILREVIAKLDIPRPQVFVEVMIAELTVERGLDLGFEFRSTNDAGEEGVQVIGGSNYGGIQQAAANPLGITGFAIGAADGTLTYAGETFPNIGALFRAMQSDRDVNILATPHILTTDNEDAEIVIANNVPFITGQIFSQNFNNPTTTIERKDVGITLRITPSINESDMVRLTIYQESSSVTDSPSGLSASDVGITTAKRSADTVVVVKSRQTVVIGGLMQDNVTYTEAKVPVLGDIPLLGYLFKTSKKKVEKTNLLFFITPYIIKDTGDLEEVTRRANFRLQQFREQNRLERRNEQPEEQTMTPQDRVFRREDPNAIETDPLARQGEQSGRTSEPPADDETGAGAGEDEAPLIEEPAAEEEPAEEPVADDGDFAPGGGE